MTHTRGNFAFTDPPFKDGDTVRGGNFSQHTPGTEICKDVTRLVIEAGNYVNCVPQPGWTVRGGNWAQISRCTHLMDTIPKGMQECADNCSHRSATVQDVQITREEAAKLKTSAKAYVESERPDKDGLGEKVFTERKYVYADKVTQVGRPDRWPKEAAIGELER